MTSGKLPFSQRHGAVPLKVSPDREHVPDLIRGEFAFKFLRQSSTKFQNMLYSDLRPIIWRVTGHEPPEPSGHHNFVWMSNEYETIKVILYACDWGTFYEICEIVFTRYSNTFNIAQAHEMQNEANLLFATELLAWRFEDGVIVPAYPKEITEIFEGKSVV